jgi:hypothetical protein
MENIEKVFLIIDPDGAILALFGRSAEPTEKERNMHTRQFLRAATIVAMLAAVMASGASAASKTAKATWHVEGIGVVPEKTKLGVECELGEHNGEKKAILTGEVGSVAPKTPVTLTATGVRCIEAVIYNEGGAAKDTGKLEFTGVTVSTPPSCTVSGGAIKTNLLESEIYEDEAEPKTLFDRFAPDAAAGVSNFANVTLAGTCPISGVKIVKGVVFGQATNKKGVQSVTQPLTFESNVEATSGSVGALEFAGNPAELTGDVINKLAAPNAGKKFWVE